MKKVISILLVFIMCLGLVSPQIFPEVKAETSSEEASEDTDTPVSAAYQKKKMIEMKQQDQLIFDDSLKEISMEEDEKEGGILLSASGTVLSSGRITWKDPFDFDQNAVGRLSVDGLASKGSKVTLDFYLDDEEEAFTSVTLKKQKKTGKWTYDGEISTDVLEKNIQGSHQVSFQIVTDETEDVTVLLRSIEFVQSSIPVIYFDIDETEGSVSEMNNDPDHDTECYGDMTLQIPAGYQYEYEDKVSTEIETDTYSMEYIRGRGNSTWGCDKKPYKIKLDKKADFFGMGKNKHWVLLANRFDNSKLRNKATYWLGKELGMEYTPECVFVDVVMNGTYYGSYYLSEQVRIGSGRVDIDDLEESEETKNATDAPTITGGYLLSMFPYGDEANLSFMTTRENEFLIERPAFEDYKNDTQYNYIKDYVQKTEDAIYGKDFQLEDGTSYQDLMDLDAAVDYWWIQEISQNGDGFGSTSTYLYKKRSDKLYWGPLWDFDYVAWGDYDYSEEPECSEFYHTESTWFGRLFEDKAFAQKVVDRWPDMKAKLEELCAEGGQLDQYVDQLSISQYYDYEKWGAYDFGQEKPLTFQQEEQRLKDWITTRTAWLDANVESLVPKECKITYINDGKTYATDTVVSGHTLEKLPKAPKKKGYVFAGWYYNESGEQNKLMPGNYIYSPIKAKAKWVKKDKVKKVEKLYFEYKSDYAYSDDEYEMNYSVMPLNATLTDVTWKTSNKEIATVESDGTVYTHKPGTVKITGTCSNGVSASYTLHVLDIEDDEDFDYPDTIELSKKSVSVKAGGYTKLNVEYPKNCEAPTIRWISLDEDIAEVTDAGVVIGKKKGETNILAFDTMLEEFAVCKVKVTSPGVTKGTKVTVGNLKYKVTSNTKKKYEVACIGQAKKKSGSVTIPSTIKIQGKTYKVTIVGKEAFKGSSVTSVTMGSNVTKISEKAFYKCKKLKKLTIKSSKLKSVGKYAIKGIKSNATIKVPSGKKSAYKKLFTSSTGFVKKNMKIK